MNNTFVVWLLGMAVAGLGLLLFFGTPVAVSTATSPVALTTYGAAPAAETASYWHDATPSSHYIASETSTTSASDCSSCSTGLTGSAAPAATAVAAALPAPLPEVVGLTGGCGTPAAPCAEAPCGPVASCALGAVSTAHCEHAACGHSACGRAACEQTLSCAPALCEDRPKINRNGPSCVDECSFIQFTSTVPLPVCKSIRFAWAATRGEFLDPMSPTPIYYAPETGFPGGEDVLITLTVTDAQHNEYSDQMKLHVRGGT